MKKLFTYFIFNIFYYFPFLIFAQIPNADFEIWKDTPYDEPEGWITPNFYTYVYGGPAYTAYKVEGQTPTKKAVALYTNIININYGELSGPKDTIVGFLATGDANTGKLGFPISSKPLVLYGLYKNYLPKDAYNVVQVGVFKWNNILNKSEQIGGAIYKINTQDSLFTSFEIPIIYSDIYTQPDSAFISIYSSDPQKPVPSSTITIDEVSFTSINGNQTSLLETSSVYPNPAIDEVLIKGLGKGEKNVEIMDLNGIVKLSETTLEENIKINTELFNNGIYFYNIYFKNHSPKKVGKFSVIKP